MLKPFIQAVIIVTFVLSAGNLYAGDTVVLDIKPPTSNEPIGNFDGNGTLMLIDNTKVVIGDALYRLGPGVSYFNYDGSLSSSTAFPVGIQVWFVLLHNDDNTIESLWKEGG